MLRLFLTLNLVLLSGAAFAQDVSDDKTAKAEKEPLSLTAFSTQQRAHFNKADKNFDGRITRDEIQMARFEGQKKNYEKRFKELDTNFSGFLEPSEIEVWHVENTERRVKGFDRQRDSLLKTYDLDKNGTISSPELDDYFEAKADKERDKALKSAERDFNGKDKDESGSVSLDEYYQSKMPRSGARSMGNLQGRSLTQDKDGDGVITRSENEDFIAKAFEYLDKDDDGELSAKEQKNNAMGAFQSYQPHSVILFSDEFAGTQITFGER